MLVDKWNPRLLHPLVEAICRDCNAWIIGSTAEYGISPERDIDIMVPLANWHIAVDKLKGHKLSVNRNLGYRLEVNWLAYDPSGPINGILPGNAFISADYKLDIWPDSLERLIVHDRFKFGWQPTTNTRIRKSVRVGS